MASDVFDKLKFNIQKEIESLTFIVSNGHCETLDSYRGLCGQIFGLNQAIEMIEEERKKFYGDEGENG